MDFHPFIETRYNIINLSLWRKLSENPSICMSRVKERQSSERLGRTRSRTIRVRERRGLNHPPFEEVHFSKDKEPPVSIRFLILMGKGEDNLLNVGDVEEITSKGFVLSKAKAP